MRTVTFASVLDGVLALAGMKLDATIANPDTVKVQVTAFINLRVREAWEYEFWPELCPTEERFYRPAWNEATAYTDATAELYFAGSDTFDAGYFSPNADDLPAIGESPETDPGKWVLIETMRRFVALDQAGMTEIGEVMDMWKADPRLSPSRPYRLPYTFSSEGIVPGCEAGNSVWIQFRIRPYQFTAEDYVNDAKVIPYVFAAFVQRAAYADLLTGENRMEDAGRAESAAYRQLNNAVDQAGASQGQFQTAQVRTY